MASTSPNGDMSFMEHLEELRGSIFRSLWAVVICAAAAFCVRRFIFEKILLAPMMPSFFTNALFCRLGHRLDVEALCINSTPAEIQNIAVAGQFNAAMIVSAVSGLIAAFPYIVWEGWRFIKPALYAEERQRARGAVWVISGLFFLGVVFGYYIIAPLSIQFFINFSNSAYIQNMPTLQSYISTVSSVTLGCGLLFELPVLVMFLTRIGLLTPEFLIKYRRHAIVLLLLLSAIITPPDVFSQIVVVIPLAALYEAAVSWSKHIVKQKEQSS